MTTASDYLGHDLGLGGFQSTDVDLTDVADAEAQGVNPPPLYFVIQASVKTVGSSITSDGRRLKVTGAIVDGFRLDEKTGREAVAAMRVQRRKAEDEAKGVANLPGMEGGEVPDVGTAHTVAGDGTVLTDAEAEAARDPFADADAAAREAVATPADEPAGEDAPRWLDDDAQGQPAGEADDVDGLPVSGDAPSEVGLAYVAWAWTTGNPLDADEAKVVDTIDEQDAFDLWELDLLLELERRGAGRDEVLAALSGRRTAELALGADREPWEGFGKAKVSDAEDRIAKVVGAAGNDEDPVLAALKIIDAVERFELSHKDRAGVLKLLEPARAELIGRLFPGADA